MAVDDCLQAIREDLRKERKDESVLVTVCFFFLVCLAVSPLFRRVCLHIQSQRKTSAEDLTQYLRFLKLSSTIERDLLMAESLAQQFSAASSVAVPVPLFLSPSVSASPSAPADVASSSAASSFLRLRFQHQLLKVSLLRLLVPQLLHQREMPSKKKNGFEPMIFVCLFERLLHRSVTVCSFLFLSSSRFCFFSSLLLFFSLLLLLDPQLPHQREVPLNRREFELMILFAFLNLYCRSVGK